MSPNADRTGGHRALRILSRILLFAISLIFTCLLVFLALEALPAMPPRSVSDYRRLPSVWPSSRSNTASTSRYSIVSFSGAAHALQGDFGTVSCVGITRSRRYGRPSCANWSDFCDLACFGDCGRHGWWHFRGSSWRQGGRQDCEYACACCCGNTRVRCRILSHLGVRDAARVVSRRIASSRWEWLDVRQAHHHGASHRRHIPHRGLHPCAPGARRGRAGEPNASCRIGPTFWSAGKKGDRQKPLARESSPPLRSRRLRSYLILLAARSSLNPFSAFPAWARFLSTPCSTASPICSWLARRLS